MTKRCIVMAAVWAAVASAAPASAAPQLPSGFVDEPVTTASVPRPTAFAVTPTRVLLATGQQGRLYSQDLGNGGALKLALDISSKVCSDIERGLVGVAVDPNFAVNRFIYVFYTFKKVECPQSWNSLTGPVNRVSRLVLRADNTADPLSERVLIDNIPNKSGAHNAGDLQFGKDGYLYVSAGDGNCDYAGDGCAATNDAARDMHALLGKILRITRDGAIPPDNPYPWGVRCNTGTASVGKVCAEIFATGLRNPFRFAFDSNAAGTRFFINDVGQGHWEEIDEGKKGADYGWNKREGACVTGSYTNCPPPPSNFTDPVHAYGHDTGCKAITGGAFVPAGVWPSAYDGAYLFGDFVCGKLMRLVPKSGGGYDRVDFATGLADAAVTHMGFAPVADGGQALYYASYTSNAVRRIRYVGTVNRPPTAKLSASATGGPLPLHVTLDGSASSDPDADALTYVFDFGDGEFLETTSPVASHTYEVQGTYIASLYVRDSQGLTSPVETVAIHPGDLAPSVTVLSPEPGKTFSTGEVLDLRVSASDPEDGALEGDSITWSVSRRHDTHYHPYALGTGSSLQVIGPAPEDLAAVRNSWLEVTVRAQDSAGNVATSTFTILPKIVVVTFDATSVKVQMQVNGQFYWTPGHVESWPGWQVILVAPATRGLYKFKRWMTGSTNPRLVYTTPPNGGAVVAQYGLI